MNPVLVESLARYFRISGQQEFIITYDQDEFLSRLMGPITSDLGLDFQKATAVYHIRENANLSVQECEAILAAFANPKYFQNLQFYDGAENIMLPCELSSTKLTVKVGINTHSFTETVAALKTSQLLDFIPGLRPEDIQSNVISASDALRKSHARIPTILGEDSPYNVAISPARVNFMPETIPWACNDMARKIVDGRPTIWLTDLNAINRYVYELVEAVLSAV